MVTRAPAFFAPRRLDDARFASSLWVDEQADFMNDHTTGQHGSGMILMEAARQMFIAVFEAHLNAAQAPCAFLITEMNNRFLQFAFPVATEVEMLDSRAEPRRIGAP